MDPQPPHLEADVLSLLVAVQPQYDVVTAFALHLSTAHGESHLPWPPVPAHGTPARLAEQSPAPDHPEPWSPGQGPG